MKYYLEKITLIAFLLCANSFYSQEFNKKFFGTEWDQYLGAEFIVDSEAISGWSNSCYTDFESSLSLTSDAAFASDEYDFKTDPNRLPEGPFKIVEILDSKDSYKIRRDEARFKMLAPDGTEFWFRYDSSYDWNFPWLVGDIEIDIESICSKISIDVDDFTDEKRIRTPYNGDVSITKIISNNQEIVYLSLNASGSTINVGEKGVIILMEDGSKLNFPDEKIDSKVGKYGYDYSAFIRIDDETLSKLTNVPIDKWRLYIYDKDLGETEAELFRIQIGCINEMK